MNQVTGLNGVGKWTALGERSTMTLMKGLNDCVINGVSTDKFVSVVGSPMVIFSSLVLWDCSRQSIN